jgi:aspartyl-tRNA(Asn)/glutamyl-tRNA(Gln) amidotransferase subunit C
MNKGYTMTVSKQEIENIAHLARLEVDEAQIEKMSQQISNILKYIDKLKDVNVAGVKPASGAAFMQNVLREDELKPSPGPDVTLANAPQRDEDFYIVPRVVK